MLCFDALLLMNKIIIICRSTRRRQQEDRSDTDHNKARIIIIHTHCLILTSPGRANYYSIRQAAARSDTDHKSIIIITATYTVKNSKK